MIPFGVVSIFKSVPTLLTKMVRCFSGLLTALEDDGEEFGLGG